jgi:hypothetical protein
MFLISKLNHECVRGVELGKLSLIDVLLVNLLVVALRS